MKADEIDDSFVPARAREVAAAEVEGETVIYHKLSETIHVLNPSATVVWGTLDGQQEVRTVALRLAQAYGVDEQEMVGQVTGIIREFGRQGLLEGVVADQDVVREIRLDLLRSVEVGGEVADE
jgi:hypothetical protein